MQVANNTDRANATHSTVKLDPTQSNFGTMRGPLPSKGQRDWEKTNSGDQASQNVADTFSTRTRSARAAFYRDQARFLPL